MKGEDSDTIDGTKELEFEIENFEAANEFLNIIGFVARNYQENNRIQYVLDDVELDIDSWPMIPTYLEIEAKSEEKINKMIKKLNLDNSKMTALNCDDIYKKIYHIDISEIKELRF